ncbi:MAG: hypothetical protein RL638_2356 [Bacteroidota bacterium]
MRSLRFCSLLFFLSFNFQSWGQLQFRLPDQMLHYRLNLNTAELAKEDFRGNWESKGRLSFEQVIPEDFPFNAVLIAFPYKNNWLLTVMGTQQVYQLDLHKKIFKRLDNSFYRGYNFQAIQYIKNDTLFSLGGMGFWHANNVSTYFSFKAKEWEMTSAPVENGPRWMRRDFGGYDMKRNVLSIIEFPAIYESDKRLMNYQYFENNPKQNSWTLKGKLNTELIKSLGVSRLESEFLDGKYFFLNGPLLVWADPKTNTLFQANSVIPVFNIFFEFAYRNGYIYSYHRMNAPSAQSSETIKIDSISIEKLKSMSTYKGPFYIEPYPSDLLGYSAAAILILTAGGIYAYRKNKPQKAQESIAEPLDGLPSGASAFLNACLHYPKGHAFSSQHFTEMMGYGSYAYETQRQVRAKLIKGINSYFWAHYRMDDVIVRQTANDDKRFSVYLIAEVHYDTLKKLLQV